MHAFFGNSIHGNSITTYILHKRSLHLFFRNNRRYKPSDMKVPPSTAFLHNHVEKQYNDILKSSNDDRSYRGLILSNKMKVLLISDPTTDTSAASLDVNIGNLSDPDDIPGLAHFCEHMLFLGTEKYPEKNAYSRYLAQNGGSSNAVTYMDRTNYYFNVNPEKLEGALDHMAQFFIAPLFTESLIELELNAVNSEHEKNLANDKWRIDRLVKSSADPNHPFSKFSTGNKETLDTIPKQKGINVRERLLAFHEKYYSANIMALSVLGKESLDELEEMVAENFSAVKNKDIEVPVWTEHPFNEEHFQTKWYIVPIKDLNSLIITFPIPSMIEHYKTSPSRYISHLLGHEGKGSLFSALKAKGWCTYLEAGSHPTVKGFNFFRVGVDLTEDGIQHIDDIILLTFQYINMLNKHGPVEWIFNECRDISNIDFKFMEKGKAHNYVSVVSLKLQLYPMEDVLVAGNLYDVWDPDLITWVMSYLTPENVRIHVVGKIFENIADETEKWYGTKFKKEKVPQNIIDTWINAGYNSDFKLPIKNEFIPEKFDIKPAEDNITKFPVIIEDTPLMRLWFKQDDEFLVPKVNISIDFASPHANLDPISFNSSYMFVQLVCDALNEYAYAAELAGLNWDLVSGKYGISLGISGYDNKLHVLLDKIMDKIVNMKVDPKGFEILKEKYIRSLKNIEADQPYHQASYYQFILLSEQWWSNDELLKATPQLTVESVQQFIPQFFNKVHVECLIHGNITMSEAMKTAKLVESKLTSRYPHIIPLLPRQLLVHRAVKLKDGCNFIFQVENKFHKSSCTEVYYQTGLQSTETNMLLELLSQILSEPCHSTLRTKEQLGYVVLSGLRRINQVQGYGILVQSAKHPMYIEHRIQEFLHSMLEYISTMSEEEFEKHKEALAIKRLEKRKMLKALSFLFWIEIAKQQYIFDRADIEVAYLRTITQKQIIEFYKQIFQSTNRHKLSIHVISTVGCPEKYDKATDSEYENITDITSFKSNQYLYPLLEPYNHIPRKGTRSSKL